MLALICGRGTLPARIAAVQDNPPVICVLDGFEPDGLAADILFRLETLGGLLMELGKRGVTEVCFCGGIERPEIDPSKLDKDTAPLVPLLAEAISKGDDGALRAVRIGHGAAREQHIEDVAHHIGGEETAAASG